MDPLQDILSGATHVETARFLFELAVKASIVLMTAGALSWLLRRASAATRHLIWSSALVMVLAMPLGSLVLPAWHVPLVAVDPPAVQPAEALPALPQPSAPAMPGHRSTEAYAAAAPRGNSLLATDHAAADAGGAPAMPAPVPRAELSALSSRIDWIALLLAVWIAGAVLTALRLTLGVVALWTVASRTRTVLSREWLELTADLSRRLGLTVPVRLLQSRRATMPLSWGWMRPVVLLPADAHVWPVERRRIVLLHELAHVKRRDCLTQMLAQLVCAAYWFNPLVWFAASRLRAERERACDDLVLSAGTRSADYADHLLAIARAFRSAGFPSWATVAMAKPSQLEGRLLAILDPGRRRRIWPPWACAAAVGAIGAVAIPVAALQPWVSAAAETAAPPSNRQAVVALVPIEPGQAPAPATGSSGSRDVSGTVAGGVPGGIPGGVEGGVRGGIAGGVVGGIKGGVVGAVTAGMLAGIADGMDRVFEGAAAVLAEAEADGDDDPDGGQEPVADRRVIDALVSALKDENHDVRQQAAEALGRVADPRAIDGLTVALRDPSPEVREQAAASLSRFRSAAASGALLLALKDQSAPVRRHAVHGIARMRDARHVDALTMMLQDTDREVRRQAAVGLGQLRSVAAIEPLSAALKDSDAEVRQQAVIGLGQTRDPRNGPALIGALSDLNHDVRQQAVMALAQLRLPAAAEPLMAALKDQHADVREHAAFALGQLRDPRAVDALARVLSDASAGVRHHAVFALGELRATSATPALIAALSDKSADVREQAAFALGQIRDPRAVDALTNALRDSNADVREQAAFALGQLVRQVKSKNKN